MPAVAAKVLKMVFRVGSAVSSALRRKKRDDDKVLPYSLIFVIVIFLLPILLISAALSYSSEDVAELSESEKAWVEWVNEQYYNRLPSAEVDIFVGENGLVNPVGDPDWKKHITSRWGHRNIIIKGKRVSGHHSGLDLAYPKGHPVLAVKDGIVTAAGWIGTYGQVIFIDHGGGFSTRYGHLSEILVNKNRNGITTVRAGEMIGRIGSTGRSSGPHLHFEIRINGRDVDPYPYLNRKLQKKERGEQP